MDDVRQLSKVTAEELVESNANEKTIFNWAIEGEPQEYSSVYMCNWLG